MDWRKLAVFCLMLEKSIRFFVVSFVVADCGYTKAQAEKTKEEEDGKAW